MWKVLFVVMCLATPAMAQTYVDADPAKLSFVISASEFSGTKARVAKSAPESGDTRQSVSFTTAHDWMWVQNPAGDLRIDHYHTSRPVHFRNFDWDRTLAIQTEFKDRRLILEPHVEPYNRGGGVGAVRLFSYEPPAGQRRCAIFIMEAKLPGDNNRVTGFFCMAAGTALDLKAALKVVDGLGVRRAGLEPKAP